MKVSTTKELRDAISPELLKELDSISTKKAKKFSEESIKLDTERPLKEAFGKLKFSKPTDELLKEVDKAFK